MADPLDILTLAEARRALNKDETNTENDDLIARHVTAISRAIDQRCGPVVQREVVEIHGGGADSLQTSQWPVAELSLVREAVGGEITTIGPVAFGETASGYLTTPFWSDPSLLSGSLRRTNGSRASTWVPNGSVEVTYVAGRYEATDSVDARFKEAAAAALRRLWKRETGTWGQAVNIFEADDATVGTGFFRVIQPVLDEFLWADQMMNVPGIA